MYAFGDVVYSNQEQSRREGHWTPPPAGSHSRFSRERTFHLVSSPSEFYCLGKIAKFLEDALGARGKSSWRSKKMEYWIEYGNRCYNIFSNQKNVCVMRFVFIIFTMEARMNIYQCFEICTRNLITIDTGALQRSSRWVFYSCFKIVSSNKCPCFSNFLFFPPSSSFARILRGCTARSRSLAILRR